MAKKLSVAVLGLGQFGRSLVEELVNNGMDVIAIDRDEESVKKVVPILPTAFVAESNDDEALAELGLADVDVAIIAYGTHPESSILTTVILKELGVKRIIVRCDDEYYAKVLLKLGANEIIAPQSMAGQSLANRLWNDDCKDFYKLNDKYSVVSIKVNQDFVGQVLSDIGANFKFGVNVVLIVRDGDSFVPTGKDSILGNDSIFCVGTTKDIQRFGAAINDPKNMKKKKK